MKTSIQTIAELGKQVAFVNGNRAINKKNLNQKIESIKECGQLTPLIIVDAEDAAKEGLTLVDCETREVISSDKINEYVVIVEGQHRYTAIQELRKQDKKNGTSFAPADIIIMYALNPKKKTVKKLISELNRASVIWDGKDYITGAALCNPSSELLQFAKDLSDKRPANNGDGLPNNGYPVSTISKFTTFNASLNKDKLAQCMDEGIECLPTANIDRAKKILDTAISVGFEHKYLVHKYFIDWFIDEQTNKSVDEVCKMVSKLSPEEVRRISKVKGENYIADIRKVVLKN